MAGSRSITRKAATRYRSCKTTTQPEGIHGRPLTGSDKNRTTSDNRRGPRPRASLAYLLWRWQGGGGGAMRLRCMRGDGTFIDAFIGDVYGARIMSGREIGARLGATRVFLIDYSLFLLREMSEKMDTWMKPALRFPFQQPLDCSAHPRSRLRNAQKYARASQYAISLMAANRASNRTKSCTFITNSRQQ